MMLMIVSGVVIARMTGEALSPEWLETDCLLSQFGPSQKLGVARYKNFVRQGIGLPSVWEELKYQMYLGNDSFIEKMQALKKIMT